MNDADDAVRSRNVSLLIGGPASGKSTYLVQLFGRLQLGSSTLALDAAPASLGPVRSGLERLAQGLAVRHTSTGVEVVQDLAVRRSDGQLITLSIPDYPGEAIDALVDSRRISPHWRDLIVGSTQWNLFVRVERAEGLPGLPERVEANSSSGEQARGLPLDVRLVELLQILRHERSRQAAPGTEPELAIVLSCWDEIPDRPNGVAPAEVLRRRMPLLNSFVVANWEPGRRRVVGLSAQGRALDEHKPDEDFIDCGPEFMGYLIRADGSETDDLSELLSP